MPGTDSDGTGGVSRRTFLAAAGGASVSPVQHARARRPDRSLSEVVILTGPRHRTLAAVLAESIRSESREAELTIRGSGAADRDRRFDSGEAAVAVGPVSLTAEPRTPDGEFVARYYEVPLDSAVLTLPESRWHSCLHDSQLRAVEDGNEDRETWSEGRPNTRVGTTRSGRSDACRDQLVETVRPAQSPGSAARVFVRGVRAFQYASGYGGLGYYEVSGEHLRPPSEARGHENEMSIHLVRLAQVNVNESSLERVGGADSLGRLLDDLGASAQFGDSRS